MSIGTQLTPGRPVEIVFGPNLGLPGTVAPVCLIGHRAASGSGPSGTSPSYSVVTISNVADTVAGGAEAAAKFGAGSELAKMIVAAIAANEDTGGGTFPPLIAVALNPGDTNFGPLNSGGVPAALAAIDKVPVSFAASPFDGALDVPNTTQLITRMTAMSAAQRVDNQQFGSFGVVATFNVSDPSTLHKYDTQYLFANYLRDLGASGANPYSIGELAAACAGIAAANQIPYNPLDGVAIGGVTAPANMADWLSIGAGLESEIALGNGWSPLRVLPNGTVAFVRTRTTRITTDGFTPVNGAYLDVQDFQVLYFWRQTLKTRFSQPDFSQVKASAQTAIRIKSEVVRLASVFEDQQMFQSITSGAKLAQQFTVKRNIQDRSRFDVFTPVNVIPGLHVIATTVEATTEGDTITV